MISGQNESLAGKNRDMSVGNMIHFRFSKIIEITIIALILLTTQTIAPIQATSDFAGGANINAINSVDAFSSETGSVRYSVDPSTKKGYYFIGSAYQEFENTRTYESTVDKEAENIRSTSDMLNATPSLKVKPSQPSVNINKTISSAYLELFSVINDYCEIEQPRSLIDVNKSISDAYIELLTLINEKAKPSRMTADNDPGTNIKHENSQYYRPVSNYQPANPTQIMIETGDELAELNNVS